MADVAAPLRRDAQRHHEVEVMGTIVTFDLFDTRGFFDDAVRDVFDRAAQRLRHIDRDFSTWKPTSAVSRLRRGEITLVDVPSDVTVVLDRCLEAKRVTHGWFDPWAMPGGVDPTGLVKGWSASEALGVIDAIGARGAIVNAAGDVAVKGRNLDGSPFKVGVVNPFDRSQMSCAIEVTSALATSGTYERGEHLVDPFSSRPGAAMASASVSGPDLAMADALATALAVGGNAVLELIEGLDGYEALMIAPDGTFEETSGLARVTQFVV